MGRLTDPPKNVQTGLGTKGYGSVPCSTSFLSLFIPPIIKSLVLSLLAESSIFILPKNKLPLTTQQLHPTVQTFLHTVLSREDATLVTKPDGRRVDIHLTRINRGDRDFFSNLEVVTTGGTIFSGEMKLYGALARDRFTLACSLIDGIEFLYYHLLQSSLREQSTIRMSIGAIGCVRIVL